MKIHKDKFHKIIQSVINEYDERIKMTIQVIAPMNFFRKNNYADVMHIIKSLMFKREYIYDNYDYPKHTMNYILGVHNKIIQKLTNHILSQCLEYRTNGEEVSIDVKTMFEISEPVKDSEWKAPNGVLIPHTVDGIFNYPPINKNLNDELWREQAMADAFDGIEDYEDRGDIDIPYLGLPDDEQEIGHWNLD